VWTVCGLPALTSAAFIGLFYLSGREVGSHCLCFLVFWSFGLLNSTTHRTACMAVQDQLADNKPQSARARVPGHLGWWALLSALGTGAAVMWICAAPFLNFRTSAEYQNMLNTFSDQVCVCGRAGRRGEAGRERDTTAKTSCAQALDLTDVMCVCVCVCRSMHLSETVSCDLPKRAAAEGGYISCWF
jgi:hypothetical protein